MKSNETKNLFSIQSVSGGTKRENKYKYYEFITTDKGKSANRCTNHSKRVLTAGESFFLCLYLENPSQFFFETHSPRKH